jgi:16S rRNA (guanine(966)-N(2))-methyltransferase RsmD
METRPTTERVKEAIFSIIQFEVEGRKVLDLFGGTGQMGIEALSRGAAHCTFVEIRKDAAQSIRDNLAHTGLTERAKLTQGDALSFLSRDREKYDIVFLDPPFATELLKNSLQMITSVDKILPNGIIVCENRSNFAFPDLPAPYPLEKVYKYGKLSVARYRRLPDSAPAEERPEEGETISAENPMQGASR